MSTLFKRRGFITFLIHTINKRSYKNLKCLTTVTQQVPQINFLATTKPNLEITRTKVTKTSKKREKEKAAEADDDNSDEETQDYESLVVDKNTKIITTKVNSMRADVILKNALSMARNKVEEMFYESKIRVNGKKIFKKSDLVQEGDEMDIIKGAHINNPKFLTVARVEILEVKPKNEAYSVRLRRCKNLTIENYEDAWKPGD